MSGKERIVLEHRVEALRRRIDAARNPEGVSLAALIAVDGRPGDQKRQVRQEVDDDGADEEPVASGCRPLGCRRPVGSGQRELLPGLTTPGIGTAALAQGFRMVAYGGDLWIYQQTLRDGLAALRGGA